MRYATAVLFSIVILLPGSFVNSCSISATLYPAGNTFRGGQPVVVNVTEGQKVTVKCTGSETLGIHLHQPMKGVKVYKGNTLEITPEQFKPGNYHCQCASSIEGQLNLSPPLAITDIPRFAHPEQSVWTARPGDQVSLPCTITNTLVGVTYTREWRRNTGTGSDDDYTIIEEKSKYAFSDKNLIIKNVSSDDTTVTYTCAITGLRTSINNDLQGERPSSGHMQIKLLHDVMPDLDIQKEMATCSSSESEIDAEYCLTVTMSSGHLNKHCHSGLARGRVHGAREVSCTVIQRANGSSSVITNQHLESLASEPTADFLNGDLQITSKMIRDESTDQSRIEISFTLSQEGCHEHSTGRVITQQRVGKIIWTMSNGTAVDYTMVHNTTDTFVGQ